MSEPGTSFWAGQGVNDETLTAAVNSPVAEAVIEIRRIFSDHEVLAWPDGQGGAHVVISCVLLGPGWLEETSWVGFMISYAYPDADCYPHYVRPDLNRAAGLPLEVPFHPGNVFVGQPATMVSRASTRRIPGLDTAGRKASSVISFIQEQS